MIIFFFFQLSVNVCVQLFATSHTWTFILYIYFFSPLICMRTLPIHQRHLYSGSVHSMIYLNTEKHLCLFIRTHTLRHFRSCWVDCFFFRFLFKDKTFRILSIQKPTDSLNLRHSDQQHSCMPIMTNRAIKLNFYADYILAVRDFLRSCLHL